MNFIDEDKEKIDLVNMVVDSNFSIIGKSKRAFVVDQLRLDNKFAPLIFDELNDSTVDAQLLKASVKGKLMFNDEELLFLNRISFLLLTQHGANLNFKQFINYLTIVSDGTMDQKIDILLDMSMNGYSQSKKYIEIDSIVNLLMSSMP